MRPSMSGETPPGHPSTVNDRRTKRRTFGVRRDVREKCPEEYETYRGYAFFNAVNKCRTRRRNNIGQYDEQTSHRLAGPVVCVEQTTYGEFFQLSRRTGDVRLKQLFTTATR